MKLFLDTANLEKIEEVLKRGFVRGITTNPSLLAKEPKTEFKAHIKKIIALIRRYEEFHPEPIHLSVEVFSRKPEEIIVQACDFFESFGYEYLSVKVQIGWDELEAIRYLTSQGYSVNCTCCMSVSQALLAAAAGARYVSLFVHRITEGGRDLEYKDERIKLVKQGALEENDFDFMHVIRASRELFVQSYPATEIIAGSLHNIVEVKQAALLGAHICTVSPDVMRMMVYHFKSEERIQGFFEDFRMWREPEDKEKIE